MADWSVPLGQVIVKVLLEDWMEITTGGLTVTVVVPGAEVQPSMAAVTLKSPEALVDAFRIDGFWLVEVNPLGPVQL